MNKKTLLVLAATPMLLTACNGINKVKFEKFRDKVSNIGERKLAEKQTIKGNWNGEKVKFVLAEADTADELAVALIVNKEMLSTYAFSSAGSKTTKYYVGNGFKIKTDLKTVEWNKYGYITRYVSDNASFTVSYKYAD